MNTQLDFNHIEEIERRSRKVRSEVLYEILVQTFRGVQRKIEVLTDSKRAVANRIESKTVGASAR